MGTVRYTVFDGEITSEYRNGVLHDYLVDPLGSTVALVDNTQTITDTFSYSAFGEVVNRTGTTPTPFQYVGSKGYYRDSTTRTHVRARNFYVNLGRWMTQDPIGFRAGDDNLYRYVTNRPTLYTDKTGLATIKFDGCGEKEKKQIKESFDIICGQGGGKFRNCMNKCSAGTHGSGQDCIEEYCAGTIDVKCCDGWFGGKNCGCKGDSCGFNWPIGKPSITLCPPQRTSECSPLLCTLAHELIHACGFLGHVGDFWNCLEDLNDR